MRGAPLSLIVATLGGACVGLVLALNGLLARLSGSFLEGGWLGTAWTVLPTALRIEAGAWALTVVTLGVLWWGALGALWAHSSWGRPAAIGVACLTMVFFPIGTAVSAVVLVLLLLPASRAWDAAPS
jgi:hypothetical protein